MDSSDDFLATNKSSNLASVFGLGKQPAENASLTYTPIKPPKKDASPKKAAEGQRAGLKMEVILQKTVDAYKLVDGSYQTIGKVGLALLGCNSTQFYQLLLYKTRDDVVCTIRVLQKFAFSVLDNNYACFYADNNQNYSIMFPTAQDLKEFAQQVAIARSNAESLSSLVMQDLSFGVTSEEMTNFLVKYTVHEITGDAVKGTDKSGSVIVNLLAENNPYWMGGLKNLKNKSERAIILSGAMSKPLMNEEEKRRVLIMVERSDIELKSRTDDCGDSTVDSSAEESSVKVKGALINESLLGKSHKSSLLSRVARMGQPTLPLRGAVAADPSDSEEDSSSPLPKPRIRLKQHSEASTSLRDTSSRSVQPVVPQNLAFYPSAYHSPYLTQQPKGEITAITPLLTSTATLTSPNEANLSSYFSESRVQAAELRMGLSKVSDKVDTVLNKLQDFERSEKGVLPVLTMEPTSLLSNIQALVQENQILKSKTEEQREKLDTQNERIYHLLELSHKSMGQIVQSPKEDTSEMKLLISKSSEKISTLEESLKTHEERIAELNKENANLRQTLEEKNSEKVTFVESLDQYQQKLKEVENNLKSAIGEKKELERVIETNDVENKGTLAKCAEVEQSRSILADEVNSLKANIIELEKTSKDQQRLNLDLKGRIDELSKIPHSKKTEGASADDVKGLMNILFRKLQSHFERDQQYSGDAVGRVLATTIRNMTLEYLQNEPVKGTSPQSDQGADQSSTEIPVNAINNPADSTSEIKSSPADDEQSLSDVSSPTVEKSETITDSESLASLSKADIESSGPLDIDPNVQEQQIGSPTVAEEESPSRKGQSENTHSSYDQSWRPTEPPPLPLFDDEEEDDSIW